MSSLLLAVVLVVAVVAVVVVAGLAAGATLALTRRRAAGKAPNPTLGPIAQRLRDSQVPTPSAGASAASNEERHDDHQDH